MARRAYGSFMIRVESAAAGALKLGFLGKRRAFNRRLTDEVTDVLNALISCLLQANVLDEGLNEHTYYVDSHVQYKSLF